MAAGAFDDRARDGMKRAGIGFDQRQRRGIALGDPGAFIEPARDGVERLAAGAALVQLYTGFIYRGPALVAECAQALA